jgi:stage II sporulation protein D
MKQLLNNIQKSKKPRFYLLFKYIFIIVIIFLVINLKTMATIPVLRVGIFVDYKNITLKGDRGLQIYEIPTGKCLLIQKDNQSLKVAAQPQGIKINNNTFNVNKGIKVIPTGEGFVQVEDKKYRGEIEINAKKSLLNVINVVELEKYLYGVLKKEISPNWPAEVLKAQAIAARTFALSNMNKYIDQGYNICATTSSQEYGGVLSEHPDTNQAVNDTRGIVAIYEGQPINAVYHSDSGGYTENCEDVWGGYVPYLRSVPSEYESIVSPPNHHWSYSITEQEILTKILEKGWQLNYIEDIIIGEKTETGRVKAVEIVGDNGKKITLKANDFRLMIGPNLIRSSLFDVESKGGNRIEVKSKNSNSEIVKKPDENPQNTVSDILKEDRDFTITELIELLNRPKKLTEPKEIPLPAVIEVSQETVDLVVIFKGKGSGHGVGLSQWGAYGMATLGFSYEEILKYYYQGIQLIRLY